MTITYHGHPYIVTDPHQLLALLRWLATRTV